MKKLNPNNRLSKNTYRQFFWVILILSSSLVTSIAQEPSSDSNQGASKTEQNTQEAELKKMPLEERLKQPISLDLRNIDIIEALKFLAGKGNLNIVATKNVSGRVTLTLENIPLKDVFDLMLRSNGLAFVKVGEIYNVMTELEYKAQYGKNFSDIRQVKVLRLQYAIPEQAFSLLDALKSEIGRVLVDQESGNVLIMDAPERIGQIEKTLGEFEKQNKAEVFTLKYAKAKEVEEILKTRLDSKKVGSIKADERNNQVIVQTLPERMEEIGSLINSLDKPTKEVLIDTKIVKIKLSDQLDRGIEWEGIFNISQKFGTTYLGSYPFSVMTSGASTPTFETRTQYYNDATSATGTAGSIGAYPFSGTTSSLSSSQKVTLGEKMHFGIMDKNLDFDTLINYLDTIGETRVISNPKLVVVNNQEAKIHVGERQAYVTTTTTTGQSTSTISEEVTFVDVGIQLAVTANINDDGYITMKIKPEISSVSSVLETPTKNKIPIIDTSVTETTVMMKDGTTLLIGGMRREEKIKTSQQTPLLGKIPFLGSLFKTVNDKTERIELLVMITPHIISGGELSVGDERAFGDKPPQGYQPYQSITPDKAMLPGNVPAGIQPKSFRDYLTSNEKIDGEPLIKGNRYESN